jgi:hypothetical protein
MSRKVNIPINTLVHESSKWVTLKIPTVDVPSYVEWECRGATRIKSV